MPETRERRRYTKTCEWCGTQWVTTEKHAHACSRSCANRLRSATHPWSPPPEKACSKCGRLLSIAEFYTNGTRNGHVRYLSHCKECSCAAQSARYIKSRDDESQWEGRSRRKRIYYLHSKERGAIRPKDEDPKQKHARAAVRAAVLAGKMATQPCCVCGSSQSEAHHHDYNLPLSVVWLCRRHHRRLHFGLLSSTDLRCVRSSLTPSTAAAQVQGLVQAATAAAKDLGEILWMLQCQGVSNYIPCIRTEQRLKDALVPFHAAKVGGGAGAD